MKLLRVSGYIAFQLGIAPVHLRTLALTLTDLRREKGEYNVRFDYFEEKSFISPYRYRRIGQGDGHICQVEGSEPLWVEGPGKGVVHALNIL